ncbi:hypothetical protein EBB45_06925 [Lysinibacillus composti]|uniref:Uncharacterized protein n=2 Tax=Lysinibacillus composti TaxID=720633 RepID=A0A3N9UH38_9BACI|nr:hypothetical protein EBB45_06925 [Lysinibacillus composti]
MNMSYSTYPSEYDAMVGGFFVIFLFIALALALLGYIIMAVVYYITAKTNGLQEIAFMSWIPIVNIYVLFALVSDKETLEEIKKEALKWTLIYIGLLIVSFIPIIGFIASIAAMVIGIYYIYRLFYRWTGEQGMSILFVVLTFITGSIFLYIYGLIKMKKPFVV